MKTRYYYLRDNQKINNKSKGRPIVTVCLLRDDNGETARGVAYCSEKDNVSKKAGRRIANQRATWALKNKVSNCKIKRPHIFILSIFVKPFKAIYDPILDTFEQKLLEPKSVGSKT